MTIREKLPELARMMAEFKAISACDDLDQVEGEALLTELQRDGSLYKKRLSDVIALMAACRKIVGDYEIQADAIDRFLDAVARDLSNPDLRGARIQFTLRYPLDNLDTDDWFDRAVLGDGDPLNRSVVYYVGHPTVYERAAAKWRGQDGLSFDDEFDQEQTIEGRHRLLEEHGFPSDLSTWSWALEPILLSKSALDKLNLDLKLCDFVEWTHTGDVNSGRLSDDFGPPKLYCQATFGSRISEESEFERLSTFVWRTPHGTYVGPLWDYLYRNSRGFSENESIAFLLGEMGQGLDSGVSCNAPDFDPRDDNRLRLTPAHVFDAGAAMTRLRIKFELEDYIAKGRRAEAATEKRAKRGGESATNLRSKRIASLMAQMELLAERNPALLRVSPEQLAALAGEDAAKAEAAIWSQGRNQVLEYLGEIRRGDAGDDLRVRFLALFPAKPPKRFR